MGVEDRGDQGKVRKEYSVTNETLLAIVAGLEINSNDKVLTIGTDQAFAILEYAGEVTCVEIDPEYVDMLKTRIKKLRERDWRGFLQLGLGFLSEAEDVFVKRRNDYFREARRMERIREKLDKLHIIGVKDIVSYAANHKGFSKIYVSNAPSYFEYTQEEGTIKALKVLGDALGKDGLIYVTAHYPDWEDKLPKILKVDEELSRKAKSLEQTQHWDPRVYRRVFDWV